MLCLIFLLFSHITCPQFSNTGIITQLLKFYFLIQQIVIHYYLYLNRAEQFNNEN